MVSEPPFSAVQVAGNCVSVPSRVTATPTRLVRFGAWMALPPVSSMASWLPVKLARAVRMISPPRMASRVQAYVCVTLSSAGKSSTLPGPSTWKAPLSEE
jgi:hypothetical protein